MPIGQPAPYQHKEAFCLMWYQCKEPGCAHSERIWNSRDGVTPFCMTCPSCGEASLTHVHWNRDECKPAHKLSKGQKYWRDGTTEEAEKFMRARIEHMKGSAFECDEVAAEKIITSIHDGSSTEFRKGWPMIDIYNG